MGKWNEVVVAIYISHNPTTGEYKWDILGAPIGHLTIVAERVLGVLRDKDPGVFYHGDELRVIPIDSNHPEWWVIHAIANQAPLGGGPYDNVKVRVEGTDQLHAVGMLSEFIRNYGGIDTPKMKHTKGE